MFSKRFLLMFAALIFIMLAAQLALCQNNELGQAEQTSLGQNQRATQPDRTGSDSIEDQTMFYAFLREDAKLGISPLNTYLNDKPFLHRLLLPHNQLERRFRPILQWRRWADKHQRFLPSLLFICLVSFLSWSFFPTLLQASSEECKKKFWKSFGSGLLLSIIAMTLLRSIFLSEIGWPLGIVLAGTGQAFILVGLSVSIFNMGHSISLLLQINRNTFLINKPIWARNCDIFVGSIFAALLLQIPQIGAMPRCGSRLLALFALLGIGAFYRELKRRRASSSD